MLQSALPLADHDFHLCGPPSFMQAGYDMLLALGVSGGRVHAERLGPAMLERRADTDAPDHDAEEASVTFEAPGVEHPWIPADGTFPDLAELHVLTPN